MKAVLIMISFIFIFPLLFTLTNSFMSSSEIYKRYEPIEGDIQLSIIPEMISFEQYFILLFRKPSFLKMYWNSVFLSIPVIIGQIVIGSMMAFAFSKLRFPFRNPLFMIYVITMMMPFQVTMIPNYIIADYFGILNTHLSITLPGIFSTFGVFLLRQFMIYIPDDLIEYAKIQGASYFIIFLRIILPLVKVGIISLGFLTFIEYWNLVERPFLFLSDHNKQPLSLMLSFINNKERGLAFAAGIIFMFPVVLVFLSYEKQLFKGITYIGIKG